MEDEWIDSECEIHILKEKGKLNTVQKYYGTMPEILTCISTMIEQLLRNGIVTKDELLLAIKMPIEELKKENK